jgi:hypothetical protein
METNFTQPSGGRNGLHPNQEGNPIFTYYLMMKTLLHNACVEQPFLQLDTTSEVMDNPGIVKTPEYVISFMKQDEFPLKIWSGSISCVKFGALFLGDCRVCTAGAARQPKQPNSGFSKRRALECLNFRTLLQSQLFMRHRRILCSALAAGRPKQPIDGFHQHGLRARNSVSRPKPTTGNTTNNCFRFSKRGRISKLSRSNTMPGKRHPQVKPRSERVKSTVEVVTLDTSSESRRARPSTSRRQPHPRASRPSRRRRTPTPSTTSESPVRTRYSPLASASSRHDSDRRRQKRPRSYSRSRSPSPRSRPAKRRTRYTRNHESQSEDSSSSSSTLNDSQDRTASIDQDETLWNYGNLSISTSPATSGGSPDSLGNDYPTIREFVGQPKA